MTLASTYTLYGGAAHGGGGVGAVARGCRGRCGPLRWRGRRLRCLFLCIVPGARSPWRRLVDVYFPLCWCVCVRPPTSSVRTDCGLCSVAMCIKIQYTYLWRPREARIISRLLTLLSTIRCVQPNQKIRKSKNKNLCRCFGAPARRVFPDHLITYGGRSTFAAYSLGRSAS